MEIISENNNNMHVGWIVTVIDVLIRARAMRKRLLEIRRMHDKKHVVSVEMDMKGTNYVQEICPETSLKP